MNLLIVNDDGIQAEGIQRLAQIAKQFGKVTVVAPKNQCSAMSHCITVRIPVIVEKVEFPVANVDAYSVEGTPADCTKIGITYIVKEKPDLVLSGINYGYNVGADTLYSGTVGAAMEAILNGIPAIAVSKDIEGSYDVLEQYLPSIIEELLKKEKLVDGIWNVNFPGCRPDELKGVVRDCRPSRYSMFTDEYGMEVESDSRWVFRPMNEFGKEVEPDTDLYAVKNNYISIGKLSCRVM